MNKTKKNTIVGVLGTLLLVLTACSTVKSTADAEGQTDPAGNGLSSVVFIGDSIAEGISQPLKSAFESADVKYSAYVQAGGGSLVGPIADETWKKLPALIKTAQPNLVIYQLNTYDWGDESEQTAAYERLLSTASEADAKLAFVTMPPIQPDEFYEPHMEDILRTASVAQTVVSSSGGKAYFLDAKEVWGENYERMRDGKVYRSEDGIHTCQQGAARLTQWLLNQLTVLYPDFTPPAADKWANSGWSSAKQFTGC
ncbi:SGNH/GDSL hydrolase family protein [Lysinibacter sp. HNR]|uniref:SGNH/GDSL hydrolase family protein n=1 Tax=Lysinibacter sp. HNR TaxID=3031408 RepID=UPI0024357A05|nr:SGNH/GDSL hydrolase family protein [Lysinibacter sp. HNR]WGD37646.1 SGNH/GDSL hydrolase family protein [Lysinibacter sp. HNR]